MKAPLSVAEVRALAGRVGGVRELVAPKKRKQTESVKDAELYPLLASDPSFLRRPIIDTGKVLTLGFTADTREKLQSA